MAVQRIHVNVESLLDLSDLDLFFKVANLY